MAKNVHRKLGIAVTCIIIMLLFLAFICIVAAFCLSFQKISGRQFIFCGLVLALSAVVVFGNHLNAGHVVSLLQTLRGAE